MSDPSSGPSSGKASSARPRQLTMAAAIVIGGSVLLLLTIFDRLTNLNSLDTRDELSERLSRPPLEGSGLSVADLITGMRVGLPVVAVCAAVTAVLGIYVFQRHKGARLALSILAIPLMLGTILTLTGGFLGALVAAATLGLWNGPARDWFAGRPVRQMPIRGRSDKPAKQGPWETQMPRPSDRLHEPDQTPPSDQDLVPPPAQPDDRAPGQDAPADRPTPRASELTTTGSSTAPGATTGFGARPAQGLDQPQQAWPQQAGPQQAGPQQDWPSPTMTQPPGMGPGVHSGVSSGTVPVPVKIACILTWVFSGLVALLYAGVLIALAAAQDQIVNYVVESPEWQRSNLQEDILVPMLWVGCLMFLGWSLGACVLAWFTWRRHNWARWLLAVSAAAAFILAMFAFPVGILHQLAAVLAIVGLFLSTSRAWFEQDAWHNTWQGPPSGPPSGPPTGPPQDSPTGPPQDSPTGPPGPQFPGSYPAGPPEDRPSGGKPPVW